jgi:hypothetical protein
MDLKATGVVLVGLVALMTADGAVAYSARVKSACKSDFYKFCPSYKDKLDSPQLRACMRAAGGNISSRCIDALADSGEISRKYHSRYRSKLKK